MQAFFTNNRKVTFPHDHEWGTPSWYASLSDEQKKAAMQGDFGRMLHNRGAKFVTWIAFETPGSQGSAELRLRNASIFLLDFGDGPFAVTAGHVYSAYFEAKQQVPHVSCQVANVPFHPEDRLIDYREKSDIATFKITREEARQFGVNIIIANKDSWPSSPPKVGNYVLIVGYPEQARQQSSNTKEVSFGLYAALTPVTVITDHHITCRFDRDFMVDTRGLGIPPEGYALSGLSGAPMLQPWFDNGQWDWRLVGVCYTGHADRGWEEVKAACSNYILPDGRLSM